ncbi:MAG TPA: tetratricopeptide repeat protein [Roseimicrobium sp.]|nr:tetratricopeptide repeat protein [Roseimicrobium sp.]
MKRRNALIALVLLALVAFPNISPAPLVYRPGEGWIYEPVGKEGKWIRTRAKDQLAVAQEAFDNKDYKIAMRAARRAVSQWPLSDYAPSAQYLVGRCYEERKYDEKAFNEYQKIIEKYPKFEKYQEVLNRQFEIANRFLGGQWFKLWGVIPAFSSMDKTATMYERLIKNGPYSEVAAKAQLNIGEAREKKENYEKAVRAYETAADRYQGDKKLAADALYKAGLAYQKQSKTAEYDQNAAAQAISTFTDFIALYPQDERIPKCREIIESLKAEQARGNFQIARFYEKRRNWDGALVYYNEVILRDPKSDLATQAKERIDSIKSRKPSTEAVPVATEEKK